MSAPDRRSRTTRLTRKTSPTVAQQVAATMETKDVTNPVAQQVAATTEMPPSPMPPEQMETVKVQFTVSINAITGSATNTSQRLRVDAEAPGFHPTRGLPQGKAQPRKKQQGIPVLDLVCTTTKGLGQPQTIAQAKRRHRTKAWMSRTKTRALVTG